jgi:prevent-host-death family protein
LNFVQFDEMAEGESIMTVITAAKARSEFSDLLSEVAFGKKRVCISRNKKVIAAVIPKEDLDLFEHLLLRLEDLIDAHDAQLAVEEAEREGTIPIDVLARELGL